MPVGLRDLKSAIDPRRSILLVGAGAAIPSGAPSGSALAERLWDEVARTDQRSDDLVETASILERRYGRRAVVDAVRSALQPLQPSGGILAIPQLGWTAIFSTNFDRLIEHAYKRADLSLTPVRSNFDLTNREQRDGTTLYKIHGCITQDRAYGDKASMILTDQDYEDFDRYRQTMFSTLQTMMLSNDVVVVGHSLRDRHLSDLIKKVLLCRQDGVQTQVYVVVYDSDDLRAPLLEDRGAKICFGAVDELAHVLSVDARTSVVVNDCDDGVRLPASLVSTVYSVGTSNHEVPNVLRMFNGAPATYADLRSGATFERSRFIEAVKKLENEEALVVAIIGAAGVGKTTFSRQIALQLSSSGIEVWEHRSDFPFQSKPWLAVEAELGGAQKKAILIIDECTRYLRQANMLIEGLAAIRNPALRLIVTANAAQWTPRLKSPVIYRSGLLIELSRLDISEINSLINLSQNHKDVSTLVRKHFRALPRTIQVERLREKCGADMFVCLKNIFAMRAWIRYF